MLVFRYIDPEILGTILVQEAEKYAEKREKCREVTKQPAVSDAGHLSGDNRIGESLGQPSRKIGF